MRFKLRFVVFVVSLQPMSVVVHGSLLDETNPKLSYTVLAVGMSIVFLRGIVQFAMDLFRFVRGLLGKKYRGVEVQTLEIDDMRPPPMVFFNAGSEVCHFEGCHHLGLRATSRRLCAACRNTH